MPHVHVVFFIIFLTIMPIRRLILAHSFFLLIYPLYNPCLCVVILILFMIFLIYSSCFYSLIYSIWYSLCSSNISHIFHIILFVLFLLISYYSWSSKTEAIRRSHCVFNQGLFCDRNANTTTQCLDICVLLLNNRMFFNFLCELTLEHVCLLLFFRDINDISGV